MIEQEQEQYTNKADMRLLNAALLRAQSDIKRVEKDGRNDFGGYDYTTSEGMLTICREALHKHNLFADRRSWHVKDDWLHSVMVLTYADDKVSASYSSTVPWPIIEGKGKPYDKALAAALTTSLSYWLRDLLQVPRQDEEVDQRDDRSHNPVNHRQQHNNNNNHEQPQKQQPQKQQPQQAQKKDAPPFDVKTTLYDDNNHEHQRFAADWLTKRSIPQDFWEAISKKLEGRPFIELGDITKWVTQNERRDNKGA